MIVHFLRWDFHTFRFQWAMLAVATLLSAPFLAHPQALQILAMLYFMFAAVPAQQITGVKFRSQHAMSRNYLLSLPIERGKNFLFVILRSGVHTLPLFLLILLAPYLQSGSRLLESLSFKNSPMFPLLVTSSLFWFACHTIEMQMNWERITTYLSSSHRLRAWIFTTAVYMIEGAVMFALTLASTSVVGAKAHFPLGLIALPVSIGICAVRFRLTRRKWVQT